MRKKENNEYGYAVLNIFIIEPSVRLNMMRKSEILNVCLIKLNKHVFCNIGLTLYLHML